MPARGPRAVTTPRPWKPIRVRIACLWGAFATVETGTRAHNAWVWVSKHSGAFVFGLRARPFQAGLVLDSPVPRNFELFYSRPGKGLRRVQQIFAGALVSICCSY